MAGRVLKRVFFFFQWFGTFRPFPASQTVYAEAAVCGLFHVPLPPPFKLPFLYIKSRSFVQIHLEVAGRD